ncbi:MAG: helix-turn-helix domain-containing protein [Solirubrobacterales bacterium]
MFSENLKTVRKINGISQEELAITLNVVRQTVSKWEKGLSVPDADMLIKIADIFDMSVSELLGTKIERDTNRNDVAEQLARINEQLAIKNRRSKFVLKVIFGIIISFILINIILVIVGMISYNNVTKIKHGEVTTHSEVIDSNSN